MSIAYNDEPSRKRTLTISASDHDPDLGIIRASEPFVQALLGKAENEEVEVTTAQGQRTVTVLAIERARETAVTSVPTVPVVRQSASAALQTNLAPSDVPDRTQPILHHVSSHNSAPLSTHNLSTAVPTSEIPPYQQ
jgi:Transcription elongation factor, GreA/GreB, C-term